METGLRFLGDGLKQTVHQTMAKSFADYQIDMSYMTYERFVFRAKIGRVDFSRSVGAFSGGEMVGFTNIGTDLYKGSLSAYDAGTGIIPGFRGKGIAGRMFDFAIPKLKESGVNRFYLEVLRENEPAIKAYRKVGFEIEREYNCYMGELKNLCKNSVNLPGGLVIKPIKEEVVKNFGHFFDEPLSWENNFSAVGQTINELIILGAFLSGRCVGVVVYCPVLGWVNMLGVDPAFRNQGVASALMDSALTRVEPSTAIIKIPNIVDRNPLNEFLQKRGFYIYVKQFEMVCCLD